MCPMIHNKPNQLIINWVCLSYQAWGMWNKFAIKEFSQQDVFRKEMSPFLTSYHETLESPFQNPAFHI